MINKSKRKHPFHRLSAKTKLIVFAMVAVLAPTTILSVVQYRSLVDLEDKTKVAVEANLRQTLMQISRKLDWKFRKLAADNLNVIDAKMVVHNTCSQNAEYLSAIKKQQPNSFEVYAFSSCSGPNKMMAVLASNDCVKSLEDESVDKSNEAMRLNKYFKTAQLMQDHSEMPKDPMFYQDAMSAITQNSGGGDQVYSFLPLIGPSESYYCGFIGISYSKAYIKKKFLPTAIEDTIKAPELADLDLQIIDEHHDLIYATNPWRNGGVELHEDKEHNADVRIDNAEEHSDSVEYLIEDDAPCGCRAYFGSHLFF